MLERGRELAVSVRVCEHIDFIEGEFNDWKASKEYIAVITNQSLHHIQLFIAFSNVLDIFIDRGFGHNFDATKQWDLEFIDRVHEFDEASIRNGTITPTHMMAVLKKHPVDQPTYSSGLVPRNCIREPNSLAAETSGQQKE